jgi:hypothetical protein
LKKYFYLELLLRKASLLGWPNAKEKPSLYRGFWQKYITQDAEFFPDTSSDTWLDREKKPGLWHLQGSCNYELLLRKASLLQWRSLLAHCEREAFIIQRLLANIYHQDAEFFPDTSSDTWLDREKKQGSGIYR